MGRGVGGRLRSGGEVGSLAIEFNPGRFSMTMAGVC